MSLRRATNIALILLLAAAGLLASFAVVATAPAGTSQESTSTDSTSTISSSTTTPTTTVEAPLPDGVTVGGVPVGGLNTAAAKVVIEEQFASSLRLQIGEARVSMDPGEVGARAHVDEALDIAEWSNPGDKVPLEIELNNYLLRRYADALARRYDRPARDARVYLRKSRPHIVDGEPGQKLRRTIAANAIKSALLKNRRFLVNLSVKVLPPRVTKKSVGAVIVIHRGMNRLYLFKGERFWRRFSVATGQSVYPTPLGHYQIVVMHKNPWWYPPDSPWAAGEKPVPPGPGNPLGTRWMGLSASGVGIHGTPNSSSIGYSLSHGCVRMYIPDAEWLFERVRVGTQVFIVPN